MAVGQELLDVPIADMVRDLAAAVAEGQLSLDRASIETLKFLASEANAIDLIPQVTEVIAPTLSTVTVNGSDVQVPGISVTQQPTTPVRTTLLQAGLLPTFYQFTEALIEVKLSITLREAGSTQTAGRPGFARRGAMAFAAPVNFRNASTYSHTTEGSSLLRVTMKPVPPPVRLTPDVVTVNATVTPPVVTRTER
ncbi:MAG: hypothetical protein KAY08_00415 [Giesbergeria sp.]|jgi:hypothetical protein|nr:hypothetical protein [Giesbergeria sp.]MBP8091276.1 hypothetical protein [Giesbergeria sp.]